MDILVVLNSFHPRIGQGSPWIPSIGGAGGLNEENRAEFLTNGFVIQTPGDDHEFPFSQLEGPDP